MKNLFNGLLILGLPSVRLVQDGTDFCIGDLSKVVVPQSNRLEWLWFEQAYAKLDHPTIR
jgi:hypothetical protein